jgi:hypothetical protein
MVNRLLSLGTPTLLNVPVAGPFLAALFLSALDLESSLMTTALQHFLTV